MLTANRAAQSAQPRRGDMFIAKRTARIAKPRRGGMYVARCAAGFAKLDALMAKVRAALISAAVTGQIAVRSVSTL